MITGSRSAQAKTERVKGKDDGVTTEYPDHNRNEWHPEHNWAHGLVTVGQNAFDKAGIKMGPVRTVRSERGSTQTTGLLNWKISYISLSQKWQAT